MEASASSTKTQSTLTSASQEHLKHMSSHDVEVFGVSNDLSDINLPNNNREILQYYFYLSDRAKSENKMFSYKTFTPHVVDKLSALWGLLNIEIMQRKNIFTKLNNFIDKYQKVNKHKNIDINKFETFKDSLQKLFYIGKCKCQLQTTQCSCGLIPENLNEFILDQHNERKRTIPELLPATLGQISSTIEINPSGSNDPTYEPYQTSTFEDVDEVASAAEPHVTLKRGNYTEIYNVPRFAMMCDRFGISDRAASCLASALFQDLNIRDAHGEILIMDKSKVAREKHKCRDAILRKQFDGSSLTAFSFDGRTNSSLTREKIQEKFHSRMEKEPHLVVVERTKLRFTWICKIK